MTMQPRFITNMMLVAAFIAATPVWAGDKALEKASQKTPPLAPPGDLRRPGDVARERFGQIVLAYGIPMGYGTIVIEIDYFGNISMNNKYPNDSGQYARDALAKTGVIRTFRTLPEATASSGSSGFVLPQLLRDRGTPPPKANFRLVGSIEGAEQVVVKGANGRLDGQGGGGKTATNGGANFDRGSTRTAITIAAMLETSDSLDVEGDVFDGTAGQLAAWISSFQPNLEEEVQSGQLNLGAGAVTIITVPFGSATNIAFGCDNGVQGLPPAVLRVGIYDTQWHITNSVTVDSTKGQTVLQFPDPKKTGVISVVRKDAGQVVVGYEVS